MVQAVVERLVRVVAQRLQRLPTTRPDSVEGATSVASHHDWHVLELATDVLGTPSDTLRQRFDVDGWPSGYVGGRKLCDDERYCAYLCPHLLLCTMCVCGQAVV